MCVAVCGHIWRKCTNTALCKSMWTRMWVNLYSAVCCIQNLNPASSVPWLVCGLRGGERVLSLSLKSLHHSSFNQSSCAHLNADCLQLTASFVSVPPLPFKIPTVPSINPSFLGLYCPGQYQARPHNTCTVFVCTERSYLQWKRKRKIILWWK